MERANDDYFVFIGVIFILLTILTFFFSSITISIILLNWKYQCRSLNNLFACNSSASLFFYAIGITIQIPYIFQKDDQRNNRIGCKIHAFIYVYACAVKCFSYLIQAISRWFITVHYRHRELLEFRTNMIIILASWIVAFVATALLFIFPTAYQYEPECRLCVLTSKMFFTSFIPAMIIFFLPACTITILYGIILRHTVHIHRIHPVGFNRITSKRNVQVYRNILVLLGIVLTGGTPYFLSVVLNGLTKGPWILYSISVIFIGLAAAMESLAIFFTNHQVKTLFFKKIKLRATHKISAIA